MLGSAGGKNYPRPRHPRHLAGRHRAVRARRAAVADLRARASRRATDRLERRHLRDDIDHPRAQNPPRLTATFPPRRMLLALLDAFPPRFRAPPRPVTD